MLLAIDGSTVATGFAIGGASDGAPKGGVWSLPGADEMVFDRTLGLVYGSVFATAKAFGVKTVAIEAPLRLIDRTHSAASAMALIQLTGAIRAAAHKAEARVILCAVSTVRKHFIGHGGLPGKEAKAAVQARCRQLGWGYQDDNHADANALWFYAMSLTCPTWRPAMGQKAGLA